MTAAVSVAAFAPSPVIRAALAQGAAGGTPVPGAAGAGATPAAGAVPSAAAAARLRSFIEGTQSAQARFTQTVVDRKGRRVQEATGSMQFLRPGRFRWEYEKPYSQLLVGDGQRIWIWDRDLNQVTVRRLDRAITGTPAALLAGSNEIEKAFIVTAQPAQDGLEWIEAVPKGTESSFASVRLGFAQDVLAAMELNDALGSRTMIRFEDLQRNPKLSLQLFRFVPPKGADVLEDK
ncbi:MAG: outer membrane lipoprotein chaperone LolA [Betaproteobacteria bacterium]|nr:outer membrane lipoprotein chaperone LolA [Betaproteobacteria bacterium]